MGKTKRGEVTYCSQCCKRSHRSKTHAYDARRRLAGSSAKDPGKGGELMVYPCPHGHGWHIGHSTARFDG